MLHDCTMLTNYFHTADKGRQRGITLLLVILVLSAVLSISIGIFAVVYGELRISGEISDSFVALYGADAGLEKLSYETFAHDNICPGSDDPPCSATFAPPTISYPNTLACLVRLLVKRTGLSVTITSVASYNRQACTAQSPNAVIRAFSATFMKSVPIVPP